MPRIVMLAIGGHDARLAAELLDLRPLARCRGHRLTYASLADRACVVGENPVGNSALANQPVCERPGRPVCRWPPGDARCNGCRVMASYELIETDGGVPIKAWTRGVPVEDAARKQLENVAKLPIVFHHVAAMPDGHFGIGATVGSVVPTERAIIPAAVGVDIGCGMMAVETTLTASQLPDTLRPLRTAIEEA